MSGKKKTGHVVTVTPTLNCPDCEGVIETGPECVVGEVCVEATNEGLVVSVEPVSGGSSSVGGRARYRSMYDQINWRGNN